MKQAQLLSITLLLSCASASYASDKDRELYNTIRQFEQSRAQLEEAACHIPDKYNEKTAVCDEYYKQFAALWKALYAPSITIKFIDAKSLTETTEQHDKDSLATFVAQKPVAPEVTAPTAGLAANKKEAKTE